MNVSVRITSELDDPTIRRCKSFAIRWNYHRLLIANAYAFRSTDPKKLWWAHNNGIDIVGPENNRHIIQAVRDAAINGGQVIGGWGSGRTTKKADAAFHKARALEIATFANEEILRCAQNQPEYGTPQMYCLSMNEDGSPVHPLYQPDNARPVPWIGAL